MIPLLSKPAENQRDWPSRAVLALCLAMLISAALTAFLVKPNSDGPEDGSRGLGTDDPRYIEAIGNFEHAQKIYAQGSGYVNDDESALLDACGFYSAAWRALMGKEFPDGAAPNNDGKVRALENQLRVQIPVCYEQAGDPLSKRKHK